MAKDTRIFKVVFNDNRPVSYRNRTAVSGMFGTSLYSAVRGRPDIKAVYAANAEATSGWTEVTDDFREKAERVTCLWHRDYGGVRKPDRAYMHPCGRGCTCWLVYCQKHPEYPSHWENCNTIVFDPATCDCQVTKKLFG